MYAHAGVLQFPIKALGEAGFGRDPCVQEALRVLEVRILYDLKWRNRLSIQAGVYLMGKQNGCCSGEISSSPRCRGTRRVRRIGRGSSLLSMARRG